ncbi:MAG: colanic acid biosynthesis glycosyl transferase WcaI [Bryobacterales bacterium]|nr:colanic acid biosynthesis glycosyl transferase WcaI [Bryobacterales bacterium]
MTAGQRAGAEQGAPTPLSILILNQAFYPDVVSTAQHASELATALSERGHKVTAVCSARRYDDPAVNYISRETWEGVMIRRIWSSGFGKKARWRRAADFGTYLLNCVWQVLLIPRHDVVIALTSPPMISFVAALLVRLKGGKLIFWAMDLNPDEAIAAGWLSPDSLSWRILNGMLVYSIHASIKIIALDRFMAARLRDKGAHWDKVEILPPWSHSREVFNDAEGRRKFRATHGLDDKFVVMYSGNHSPCHPLTTLLNAALELREETGIVFTFVGGGSEFQGVRDFAARHTLSNIRTVPYQPLEELSASLSAADLHTVVMGDPFVGMVHPCKIYNILTLGTPVLYIGPGESHIADMGESAPSSNWFYEARHDDLRGVVESIREARASHSLEISDEKLLAERFSRDALVDPHVKIIESAGQLSPALAPAEGGRRMNAAV